MTLNEATATAQAEFLVSEEAAERLNVSKDTVEGYLQAGSLRGFRIGTEWRILNEDLERFTQSQPEGLRLFPLTVGMKRQTYLDAVEQQMIVKPRA